MPKQFSFICVDLQNDFASEGGKHYRPRPCVPFILTTLIPFLYEHKRKVAEICSDYRKPRPGDEDESCVPGTWGFEFVLPREVVSCRPWFKSMNDPTWIRYGGGEASARVAAPFPGATQFSDWLRVFFAPPSTCGPVVLFGLTLDCCVLCTAQQLTFRGYDVRILEEATDTYSGDQYEKYRLLRSVPLTNWASVITWDQLQHELLEGEVPS